MQIDLEPIRIRIQQMSLDEESEDILQLINVGELLIQYGLATEESARDFMFTAEWFLKELGEN